MTLEFIAAKRQKKVKVRRGGFEQKAALTQRVFQPCCSQELSKQVKPRAERQLCLNCYKSKSQ